MSRKATINEKSKTKPVAGLGPFGAQSSFQAVRDIAGLSRANPDASDLESLPSRTEDEAEYRRTERLPAFPALDGRKIYNNTGSNYLHASTTSSVNTAGLLEQYNSTDAAATNSFIGLPLPPSELPTKYHDSMSTTASSNYNNTRFNYNKKFSNVGVGSSANGSARMENVLELEGNNFNADDVGLESKKQGNEQNKAKDAGAAKETPPRHISFDFPNKNMVAKKRNRMYFIGIGVSFVALVGCIIGLTLLTGSASNKSSAQQPGSSTFSPTTSPLTQAELLSKCTEIQDDNTLATYCIDETNFAVCVGDRFVTRGSGCPVGQVCRCEPFQLFDDDLFSACLPKGSESIGEDCSFENV